MPWIVWRRRWRNIRGGNCDFFVFAGRFSNYIFLLFMYRFIEIAEFGVISLFFGLFKPHSEY